MMQNAITFNTICWSSKLKKFVALSANATNVFISSNGINWTTSGLPTGVAYWVSIAWSDDLNLEISSSNPFRTSNSYPCVSTTAQSIFFIPRLVSFLTLTFSVVEKVIFDFLGCNIEVLPE